MPPQGRVTDIGFVPADSHGSPCCPHTAQGPADIGSTDVITNGKFSLRFNGSDGGAHMACCGPARWVTSSGSGTVFINGKPAHRKTDTTLHCGGVGYLKTGSDNVMVGG